MLNSEDYYQILGVKNDATEDDIRKAYLRLASKYHPDKVEQSQKTNAHEKFIKIGEAYSVLSNKNKRREYDLRKHSTGFFNNFPHFNDFNYFDDLFKRHLQMFEKFFHNDFHNIDISSTQNNTPNTHFFQMHSMQTFNNGEGYKKEIINKNGTVTEKITKIDKNGKKTETIRTLPNNRTIKF